MDQFIKGLITISDMLDSAGHKVEASEIDAMAAHKQPISGGAIRFAQELKKRIWDSTVIDPKDRQKVYDIIDSMVSEGGFFEPPIDEIKEDKITSMVLSLAEYENAVLKLTEKINSDKENTPREVKIDLEEDKRKLNELYNDTENMLNALKNSNKKGDLDDYNRFFSTYLRHTGRRYRPHYV